MTGKKKITMTLLLGVLLLCSVFGLTASAEEGTARFLPGMTIDGSKLTLGENAFSPNYGIAPHGEYLASGGCAIIRTENIIATVEGYTSAYETCDELYVGLYMDRLEDDGTWQTVYSKEVTADNVHYLSYSRKVFVKPGYYYRMRAGHIARFGTILESNVSSTDGVYFGEGHDE